MISSPHRLVLLFLLVSAIPITALGWLGWRVLQMDATLESQRQAAQLQAGVDQFASDLERAIGKWNAALTGPDTPPGTAILRLDSRGLTGRRGVALPYYPAVPAVSEVPPRLFEQAEVAEFQANSLQTAAELYKSLAASADHQIRAGALARLARVARNQGKVTDALASYEALSELNETPVFGSPAEFLARRERIELFTAASNTPAAARETKLLAASLAAGRYIVDRAEFSYSCEFASCESIDTALAEAAAVFKPIWRQSAEGRQAWTGEHGTFVTTWRNVGDGQLAIIGPLDALLDTGNRRDDRLRFTIEDQKGRPVWGAALTKAQFGRATVEAGLPWTVRAAFVDPSAMSQLAESRRQLLVAGFVIVLLIVTAAGYVGFRSVSRELSVARLQSDFVAAVSHEFRTPLTAMRHLTDLLEEGGVAPDRQAVYYSAIGKEMRRLHGMVESLLDFGRIESGRRTYQMEATSAGDLARQVVEEVGSPRVILDMSSAPSPIRADRDALALALRNLVDNAMKYSPDVSPVRVSVEPRGGFAGIAVEDQGVGIAKDEQRKIFHKFVRGASARAMNVKGTGIGLTMAEQIVRAHGGRLELVSEPSRGSRFTILLPVDQA